MEFTNVVVVDCGEPHFSKTFYPPFGSAAAEKGGRKLQIVLWVSILSGEEETLDFSGPKELKRHWVCGNLTCNVISESRQFLHCAAAGCRGTIASSAAFCLFAARTNTVSQFSWVKGLLR